VKVLISAYACEPGRGSEPGVGWNVVRELSSRHELWVLTRANHEAAIRNSGEAWTTRVHWIFVDPPLWQTFWKKGGRGLRCFYLLWQRQALAAARRLVAAEAIDLVHHLTFGNFLPASPLADLGLPFVGGPLGGGESMPPDLFDGCDTRTKWSEWTREAARELACRWPGTRRRYRSAAALLAATPATADLLRAMGARRVEVRFQSALSDDERVWLGGFATDRSDRSGPLRLVAASRLIGWKGIDLAIDAVALARDAGPEVCLTILQDGPERKRLEARVRRLGLAEQVSFEGRLATREEACRRIGGAEALIHPAWHEAFGQVCLEALAMGVPVICLDWAGPGRIVNESCGYKVGPGPRPSLVEGLAGAMSRVLEDRPRAGMVAAAARARAAQFRWQVLCDSLDASYLSIVDRGRQGGGQEATR
jgi:glycosyltransferase involved in cell wall biosynthesis